MRKWRCHQYIDSYIEVIVEAEDEIQAEGKAESIAIHMPDEEYNRQVIANIAPRHWDSYEEDE